MSDLINLYRHRPTDATAGLRLWLLAGFLMLTSGCGTPVLTVDEMVDRAAALCDRGRGEEALQLLDQVTQKEELLPQAYYLKGLAHELSHELEQAKRAYDQCLEQAPDDSDAFNNRGSVLLRLGKFAEAQTDLMKATQLNPNDDLAWANLGLVQQELGRIDDAIVSLRRAISIRNSSIHSLQLGNLFIEKAEYAEAEQALTKSLELDSHNASAFLSRSLARSKLGRVDDALRDLESARAADVSLALNGPIRIAKQELLKP
jgi:tetratricopeptide (TPR) repeat protein